MKDKNRVRYRDSHSWLFKRLTPFLNNTTGFTLIPSNKINTKHAKKNIFFLLLLLLLSRSVRLSVFVQLYGFVCILFKRETKKKKKTPRPLFSAAFFVSAMVKGRSRQWLFPGSSVRNWV